MRGFAPPTRKPCPTEGEAKQGRLHPFTCGLSPRPCFQALTRTQQGKTAPRLCHLLAGQGQRITEASSLPCVRAAHCQVTPDEEFGQPQGAPSRSPALLLTQVLSAGCHTGPLAAALGPVPLPQPQAEVTHSLPPSIPPPHHANPLKHLGTPAPSPPQAGPGQCTRVEEGRE